MIFPSSLPARPQPAILAASPAGDGAAQRRPADTPGRKALRSVLSGGLSGGIEIMIMFPTEFVKTQMQLQAKSATPRFTGSLHCAQVIVKEQGFFGLYRGLSTLLAGSVPKAAIRFGAFEQFRSLLVNEKGKMTPARDFLAGLGAGVSEAILIVTPMEMVKTRMIHDRNQAKPQYRGMIHCITTIAKQEGVGALYKGLAPTILKQGSNQAVRFATYGKVVSLISSNPSKPAPLESASAGAVAGALSVFANNPVDVIKTRMQGLDAGLYKSSIDCGMSILRKEGFMYFYKGVGPRLARVTGDVAIVMTLYNQLNRLLEEYI
eukprot:TRINITY_DN7276_c0_g1_i1.p1 TRINITY_DN7276_c0_g1~~TRINITY_DN7276_c0_g1_i1.p1  ORF type:complete len:320 (-),score=73.83 TRINITY_DN7276_c0_g1_i1:53-1012(-)